MRAQGDAGGRDKRVFTVPNALTLLRLAAVPCIMVLLLARADLLAAILFVLAALTDFFDGRLARRAGPTSVGQVLDPLADRLMLSGVAVVLAIRDLLPELAVAVLVGRDLLALAGSALVKSKIRVNRVGKAATAVLMAAVALVVFDFERVGEVLFYAGICLSLAAGAIYAGRLWRLLRDGGASL